MIDRLLFTLKGAKGILARCGAWALIAAVFIATQALSLAWALTELWKGASLLEQIPWLALFACCFAVRQLAKNRESIMLDSFAEARAKEFRESLRARIFDNASTLVQREGTGNLATLQIEGVDRVESYLRMVLPRTVTLVVVPVVLLVLLVYLDWVSALIGLLVFPAIILQMVLIGHTAKQQAGAQHAEYQRLANHFLDTIRGIDTLKLFGRSTEQADKIYDSSERFREATMKTLRTATLSGAVLDAFSTISIAAVAVMLGFRLVDGSLSLFPALAALIIMPDYFRPIREFASDYHATLDGKNALASLLAIIDAPVANESSEETIELTDQTKRFRLSDVSYSYEDHRALKHITLDLPAHGVIGLIGASGCGKSTLSHLLAGTHTPESGFFDIDGERLSSLDVVSWTRHVAYLPQNPHLFNDTLRANVAFYRPDATDEQIDQAIRVAGLEDLVSSLPEGLDTIVGEGSRGVSGGQAQRIALARVALHRDCRVLVLDEPTAHLDIETELDLKERLLPLMEGKLVFFATHRLHWLSSFDQTILLDHGSVVCAGSTAEMCATNETFRRFVSRVERSFDA